MHAIVREQRSRTLSICIFVNTTFFHSFSAGKAKEKGPLRAQKEWVPPWDMQDRDQGFWGGTIVSGSTLEERVAGVRCSICCQVAWRADLLGRHVENVTREALMV